MAPETLLGNSERKVKKATANFALAMHRIGEGEQGAAVDCLRRCVDLGMVQLPDYYFARAFLKAFEEKREWATEMIHRNNLADEPGQQQPNEQNATPNAN